MKRRQQLIRRILTGIICGAMLLSSSGMQAMAAAADTVVAVAEESDADGATEVSDTALDAVVTVAEESEVDETTTTGDVTSATEDADAQDLTDSTGTTDAATVASSEQHTITGFVALDASVQSVTYDYDEKPTAEEVIADLPQTLEVYLDGSEESSEIPVTWYSPIDYDGTDHYWYEFDPSWDETVYTLACEEEAPYIGVNLTVITLSIASSTVTGNSNETTIFTYLVNELGLNSAAATGVLANIRVESNFSPTAKGDWSSTLSAYTSYGICQWHDTSTGVGRWTNLKTYCSTYGYDYTTLEGQLAFLKYELTTTSSYYKNVYLKLLEVSDDADGAYEAAYIWCRYFEIPADVENEAVTRGHLARDTYWPTYKNVSTASTDTTSLPEISGASAPVSLTAGKSYTVTGTISSASKLTNITVAVYDTSGTLQISGTAAPNTTSYTLKNSTLDNSIKFATLSAGVYTYKITATNSAGTATLVESVFVVLSTSATISDGTYYITSKANASYGLGVASDSSKSGANVQLAAISTYSQYKFVYQSDGYYKIQNVGSGKYLSVDAVITGSNALQYASSDATLWQVLSDGAGSYYLVPKSGTRCCLTIEDSTLAVGQNVQLATAALTTYQRWNITTDTYSAPTISGATKPGTLTQGSAFSIKGTITSSNSNITSVTVAVYDTSGTKQIGKTVKPNAKSYSLSLVDASIKFGSLSAGVYRYKVTATNSWGTETLVNKVFIVLGTSKTIAEGTYYITTKVNTSYGVTIKSNSTSSGASAVLAAKTTSSYMQFKFVYKSNGYYTIQDVGTGKYLSVKSSSSSSGANVVQYASSSATQWQVLSDGTGSYYLVPKCATTCCLYLADATAAAGTNVKIKTASIAKAQRWTMKNAATAATISGETKPGTITQGSAFSIKGTISSDTTITSVTVAVYDTSGTKQIGKTVKPNAKSYNLKNVDASIKFGSLSAGVYKYKVTATNSYGKKTLVNKTFIVLSKSKTVSNGTYYITSKVNTSYCLGVKSNSTSSGANIQLVSKSSSSYKKFKFVYKSNGYYTIQDVGTGKYLAVKNSSSSSGANIIQSSTATYWQVLPDGTGSYYLVPKCGTSRVMYLLDGTAAAGTNIQTKTASIAEATRWTLKKS